MPKCKKRYKDMDKYREYVKRNNRKYYRKNNFADSKRKVFTSEEIKLILDHDMTDAELAQKLKRSIQSIQIKRCRLNKDLREQKKCIDIE